MKKYTSIFLFHQKAQTAIEYILLLSAVTAIVLVGFKTYLVQSRKASKEFFNEATKAIMGEKNRCGNGKCDDFEDNTRCPIDECKCGDGKCEGLEDNINCSSDCAA
ncbi:MAG TPA: hypothetical protein DD723_00930 [Candidatus Omnitrophica bacterium]|nr:MAG: hypothetical protein A2Z81_02495 [Omnitrophica WOR_2 bacterium GWA2_45_18]HBR14094.1 hypothetical protein [Candidatus Omnitrophota bacterium]